MGLVRLSKRVSCAPTYLEHEVDCGESQSTRVKNAPQDRDVLNGPGCDDSHNLPHHQQQAQQPDTMSLQRPGSQLSQSQVAVL
jgi:hypothetical protein